MDKREPPYVVRAREIDGQCRSVIKQGVMGHFDGYNRENLKASFTCALTFTWDSEKVLYDKILSILGSDRDEWLVAVRDSPLHATVEVFQVKFPYPANDVWCTMNIWNMCNYATQMLLKLTDQEIAFKKLCWDTFGNLILLADMDFLGSYVDIPTPIP